MSWDMHAAVRGAITELNDDIAGAVYVSTGNTNVRGILTPTFTPVSAMLQVQAQKHDPMRHERSLEYTNSYLTIYAYGNFSDIERPDGKGGDVCNFTRPPGGASWYYINNVLEWWPDWCCFEVVRQLDAASIAALIASLANGANPA